MNSLEEELIAYIKKAVKDKYQLELANKTVMIEIPKDQRNGDYATNIAMRLAKTLKTRPLTIAEALMESLKLSLKEKAEVTLAAPGFINFKIAKNTLAAIINTIIAAGERYGENNSGNRMRVLVEYVSANPTGILHLGHARGAAWGDAVCRLLKASDYDCLREYYINDAGKQIEMLALSLEARYRELFSLPFTLPSDGYHGEDIRKMAEVIKQRDGDKWLQVDRTEALKFFATEGKRLEMARIRDDLAYFRCEFDSWVSEKDNFDKGLVAAVVKKLTDLHLTYEADGALWFKSSSFGDDKDRVLRKSDGFYTYLTPDIAYHLDKFNRGYQKLINFWGADHHGYIARMKAALKALGYAEDDLLVDIIQMVRLVENGEEVKMSKRTGNAVTIRELCDDIGVDAARYFFLARALDTHLDFDLDLARRKSEENPVYYAQYAYARICSILRQAPTITKQTEYRLLKDEKERELLKYLTVFPSVVADAAITRAPNKICNYIQKLAAYFHSFYAACRVIDQANPDLTNERLALLQATQITLKNALTLLGVSAPEKM